MLVVVSDSCTVYPRTPSLGGHLKLKVCYSRHQPGVKKTESRVLSKLTSQGV